ncbi:MAG: ROK family protein [Bacteroidota bacterium]
MSITIGIDLGGTRIKGVALDTEGKILHQNYTPTNDGNDAVWKKAIVNAVKELQTLANTSDTIIGISAPGISNESNTAIAYMPGRLQGLENFNWSEFLQQPVRVLNDAVAALMAEARLGAAKNKKNAALLTLGTGVGGALLIDGKPYQGSFHKAGHLGHMVIDSTGDQDVTGMPGSLEEAIGNVTIQKRSDGKFQSTHELLECYRKGDAFARSVWLTSVRKLAIGIASITNILSPECVVIGGGITEAGKDLFEPLDDFMAIYEWRIGGNKTEIIKAAFGDMAGAIGAACFASETIR